MVTPFANSKIKIINRGKGWMLMDHFEFSLCFTASHLLVNFSSTFFKGFSNQKDIKKCENRNENLKMLHRFPHLLVNFSSTSFQCFSKV